MSRTAMVHAEVRYHFTRAEELRPIVTEYMEKLERELMELGYDVGTKIIEEGQSWPNMMAFSGKGTKSSGGS